MLSLIETKKIEKKMGLQELDNSAFLNKRFVAIKEHLFSELKGEGVILSLKNGKYYGLNEVGRSIWSSIQNPATFAEIQAAILAEYNVDEEICREEVAAFLRRMAEEDLVEVLDKNVD